MLPYLFQSPFFSLRWENVAIVVGILAGIWLVNRRAAHKGQAYQDMLLDLYIYLIVAGIAGARLWDVLFTWEFYRDRPWEILAVWNGGMSIQGSILGGLVAACFFARSRRVRPWELLDLLAPSVILGQGIGRIGCFLSGDAFGRPISEVPWLPQWLGAAYQPGTPAWQVFGTIPLVPAEAMESILDFVIMGLLLWIRPRQEFSGRIFLLYGILYSGARFSLEFFRADSLLIGSLKSAQLLSIMAILVCGTLYMWRRRAALTLSQSAGTSG